LAPTAVRLLTRYFNDINNRNFDDYRLLFVQEIRVKLDPATLASGYRSTADSGARLINLAAVPGGRATATVTFTSRQNAIDGPDGETCTEWTVMFFLQTENGAYVFGKPPADYHAQHKACR